MKTVIVTDSASALSPVMRLPGGIVVVPLRVSIDDVEHAENDLDAAHFYERLAGGARVHTSQPSPGDFIEAYTQAAKGGAERVLSIHISGVVSGTVNSARLAAQAVGVPVEIVDTGTASMAAGLAVLAVAAAILEAPTVDAHTVARAEVGAQRNVFISLDPKRLQAGGRMGAFRAPIPVLSMTSDGIRPVAAAATAEAAVDFMADWLGPDADGLTAWVGDGGASRLGDELAISLQRRSRSLPVRRYTVPPSVGANTGPTVGIVLSRLRLTQLPTTIGRAPVPG